MRLFDVFSYNDGQLVTESLNVQQLAAISDEALDNKYHYGRSTPGNTFGWQANLASAAYAKQAIESGFTKIDQISDAVHNGWWSVAQKFVDNPDQFSDTETLRAKGKFDKKMADRIAQMVPFNQLTKDQQDIDRVVAEALLQAITGGSEQGVTEGQLNELDMWAPVTTFIKMTDGSYVQADWRRSQPATNGFRDSASFINFKPVNPTVVKQLGLDSHQRNNSISGYRTGSIAGGGDYQSSGPMSSRRYDVVDYNKPETMEELPDEIKPELIKWIQKQGVAEGDFGPAATAAIQQGKSPSDVAYADTKDINNIAKGLKIQQQVAAGDDPTLTNAGNAARRAGNTTVEDEEDVAEGTGQVEAYGYRYNNRDQRVVWRKNFPSSEAAHAWADKHNATVIGVRAVEKAVDEAFRLGNKRLGNKRDRFKSIHKPSLVETEPTHRIGVTVTDPNHAMVSKRGETVQKSIRVTHADRDAAINRAIAHYRRKGYKVHDHHYMGTVEPGVAEGSGGNWYIRVNGKILNDTKFKPVIFSSEDEARSHAMKLADKKRIPLSHIKLTKSWMDAPEQGVAEGLGKQIHGTFQSMGDSFSDAHLAKGISYFLQGRHQEGENWLRGKIPEKAQHAVFSKLKTLQAQPGVDINKNPNIQKYIDDKLVPWVKSQIQQGVAEGVDSENNPWHVTDVDAVSETDFEVALQGPAGIKLNFVIRPVDFVETQRERYQIDSMDVRDLQSGKTMHWGSMQNLGKWEPIFDAIDEHFWMDRSLQAHLAKIVDYYMDAGEHGKNPDMMSDLDKRDPNGIAVSAKDFVASHNQADAAIKSAKKGVAEGSQRVDSLVTDALRVMKGPEISDAVLALKRVLGDRAYNERRGFYSFYVDQIHRNWQLPMYGQQGVAEGSLNEFSQGSGGGESGRWYTDDEMTDIVGDGWWQDMDVSGANIGVIDSEVPKEYMIQQAQAWLDDQGYSVQVLNCKVNDDDMEWYIEGSFQNSGFAKKGVAEGNKKKNKKTSKSLSRYFFPGYGYYGSGESGESGGDGGGGVAEAGTSAAVRLGRAIERTQGKTAASQARSVIPSSIPKKEEPKKDEKKVSEGIQAGDGFIIECGDSAIETVVLGNYLDGILIEFDHTATFMLTDAGVTLTEAEYQGRTVPLGKRMAGDVKKSKVYVKKPNGNVVKVNFGDKNMTIKKHLPKHRKSYRARHHCENPGPKWKANYWSCRAW